MAEPPAYDLRPISPEDDELVYDIYRRAMEETTVRAYGRWDEVVERAEHAAHFSFVVEHGWIIRVDGAEAGLLIVKSYPDYLYLVAVHLTPEFQRRGIGTRIIQRVLSCAAGQGKRVELEVLKANPARTLYERLGFRITHEVDERTYRMETEG